jgi:hypothetical protein
LSAQAAPAGKDRQDGLPFVLWKFRTMVVETLSAVVSGSGTH